MARNELIEKIIDLRLDGISKEALFSLKDEQLEKLYYMNMNLSKDELIIKGEMVLAIMYIFNYQRNRIILWTQDFNKLKLMYLNARNMTYKDYDELINDTIEDFKNKAVENSDDDYMDMTDEQIIIASGIIRDSLKTVDEIEEEKRKNKQQESIENKKEEKDSKWPPIFIAYCQEARTMTDKELDDSYNEWKHKKLSADLQLEWQRLDDRLKERYQSISYNANLRMEAINLVRQERLRVLKQAEEFNEEFGETNKR